METYGASVLRAARSLVGDHHRAEEVYQETFAALFKELLGGRRFESSEHEKAWLLRVSINKGRSLLRSASQRREFAIEDVALLSPAQSDGDLARVDDAFVWDLVARLGEDQRIAVYLHYVEGYEPSEIARILRVPAATVRTRLHRARKELRAMTEGMDLL